MGDARHVSARAGGILVHSLYVPAGGEKPDVEKNPKFAHKMAFFAELNQWLGADHVKTKAPMVLCGDLNVAPLACDVWDHKKLLKVVTHTPVETDAMKNLLSSSSLVDVIRQEMPAPERLFTWWSYRAGKDWKNANRGRRLDHIWTDATLAGQCVNVDIVQETREWTRPSDHVPVLARFQVEFA